MFNSIWRRFTQWQSRKTPIQRRPKRTLLSVEMLEDRVTPSLSATISTTGILMVTSSNASDSLTVASVGYQLFTITDNAGFQFTSNGLTTFTNTAAQPILAMAFTLNGGGTATSLNLAGTAAAPINLVGPVTPATGTDLTINATGTNVNITATNLNLLRSTAGLSMTLAGVETTSFTDTNVTGSAIINHTGAGNTNFNLNTSAANPTALNTWGSLAITNGIGADSQIITDTDFTGSVTINNGAGSGTGGVIYPNEGGPVVSSPSDGGSQTWIYGLNNQHLLTIGGNLTVITTTGQSDTEINNYNVLGAFTVNGGAGIAGQQNGSIVAINNCPVFPGGPAVAGVPVFGSISITAGSILTGTGVNAGLNVLLGTGVGSELGVAGPIPVNNTPPVFLAPDYPFIVTGALSVSATGAGSVNMYLDGLTVGGAATLTTSATNNNGVNIVVLGDQATTSFGSLSVKVLSNATGVNAATNNVYLQAQQGTMNVTGALNVNLGSGNDTVMVGSAVPGSNVSVGGIFGLTGTGGNKIITVVGNVGHPGSTNSQTFGGLSWTLLGTGTESASFTDTNITGSSIVNHTGTGNTNFDIQASAANATALNTWGSLSITNGIGADSQIITDTDFTGSVAINNGAGSGTGGVIYPNEGQDGGSQTWIYGLNNQHLLTIGGNLTVITSTGQSDTEINNYNVLGAFTVNGGAGIAGQQNGSIVAINNCPVFPGGPAVAGVPVFGSISITAGSILTGTGVNAGLNVLLGTGVGSELGVAGPIPVNNTPPVFLAPDYPFSVAGALSVSATGAGSVNMYLDGLTVGGAATLTTSATNNNGVNIVVLGDQATTSFGSLSVKVLSNATGVNAATNNVYLQAQQGTMNVTGALNVNLGSGNDTVMVGSAVIPGSNVSVGGIFGLTGTGGNKIITVVGNVGHPGSTNSQTFGGLSWTLLGTGTESASFTDTNITGSSIVNHTGTGNTNFDIQISAANATALNTWGSLSITNGIGADSQIITDTDFTGSVAINNGAGSGTGGVIYPNEGQDGGSQTWIYGLNNQHLLTIGGNLTVITSTGQSDTEINNYNVLGAFTVNGGAGIAGQLNGSIVAINNCPVFPGGPAVAGVPVFGSISITAGSILTGTGVNAGLNVLLGTGVGSELGVAGPIPVNNTPPVFLAPDYPFIVTGALSVSATGAGSVNMYLDGLTVGGAATLTTSATNNNGVNIVVLGDQTTTSFGSLTVNVLANATAVNATNNVYLQAQQGTMNVTGALNVNLGAGADNLMIGSANSSVNVTGTFTLNAKPTNSKAVSISALDDTFGALNWTLSGKGTETALFTDTNVTGTATINTSALTGAVGTTGVGASPTTTFTINTSAANTATFNTWGGLAITNGTGSDINSITDTNFKGNVTIANGAGATGDSSQFGGSDNIMSAVHDNNLLFIMGSLSITTTTGQSDTEVSDYNVLGNVTNVHGNVTLGAGTGAANQTNANVIGLEDNQTTSGATPVISGNVTITGSALATANPNYGLLVALGTNVNVNQNLIAYTQSYPLIIQGNLAITVAGSGSPDINLNDLTVATGSTTITLAAEVNSLVQVQGTNFVSVYNTFTISSQSTMSAGGDNIYSFQDTPGTLEFNGAVKVTVAFTGNIFDLAADAGQPGGVPNALLDLFGTSSFTGGAAYYAGTLGTNLFDVTGPTVQM